MTYADRLNAIGVEADTEIAGLRTDLAGSQAALQQALNSLSTTSAELTKAIADRDAAKKALEDHLATHVVAPPPPVYSKFTFAVVPDTQNEVIRGTADTRMNNRAEWLVSQKVSTVLQTGDLVNWDTADHAQTRIAAVAFDKFEVAKIPYLIAIGNHDNQATGVGGSNSGGDTHAKLRDTTTLNSFFTPADFGDVDGSYPNGHIDNTYSKQVLGGVKWLFMAIEFCPRQAVVDWAAKAIADNPDHNVVVATHSFQNGGAPYGINGGNDGYGDLSPQQLWTQALGKYPNVKMIFSGHVGFAAKAVTFTGAQGNKVLAFLTTIHDNTYNPVRMVDVDVAAGTLSTRIYAPNKNYTYPDYTETLTGINFIK